MSTAAADIDVAVRVAVEGFAVVDLLDQTALAALTELRQYAQGELGGRGYSATFMSRDSAMRRRVHQGVHAALAGPLRRLLPGHRLCNGNLTIKRCLAPDSEVPLHQDWSFVDESCHLAVAFWCPLIDVDTHNGCLAVVPGSHRLNRRPRSTVIRFPYPDLEATITQHYLRPRALRAGQALLFNAALMHASSPNLGRHERVAAAGLLVPDEAPLRLYYAAQARPEEVRVFAVPDDYLLSYQLNSAPDPQLCQIDEFAHRIDPVSPGRLRECLQPFSNEPDQAGTDERG